MQQKHNIYFYTYGSDEKFPYQFGWTEIEAPDWSTAHRAFRAFHPSLDNARVLNCADFYTEDEFKYAFPDANNLGKGCHERITVEVYTDVMDDSGNVIHETIGYRREVLDNA